MPSEIAVDIPQREFLSRGDVSAWNRFRQSTTNWLKIGAIDLAALKLRGINFSCCDLSGSNLKEADLTNANLGYANLSNTNLRGTMLNGSTLLFTDFRDSDADGASFATEDPALAHLFGGPDSMIEESGP